MLCGSIAQAQSLESDTQTALQHVRTQALAADFESDDLSGLAVDYAYTDEKVGITYVYLKQQVGSIAIDQAVATVGIKDGKVYSYAHRLVANVAEKLTSVVPVHDDASAVRIATSHFGHTAPSVSSRSITKEGPQGQRYFADADFVNTPIAVQDFYQLAADGKLHRVLGVTLDLAKGDYQRVSVDAIAGNVLSVQNYTVHCSFGHDFLAPHTTGDCDEVPAGAFTPTTTSALLDDGSSYRVFAWPAESPSHGPHIVVSNPADAIASPHGWHDTNGSAGAEYTITRGNNAHAYMDALDNDSPSESEPDGGASLTFDFPYDASGEPIDQSLTTTTNLFYTVNQMHDFTYQYGFDEQGGNFQANNYGNGGAAGDHVFAQSQDGGVTGTQGAEPDADHVNNANFATPGDGSSGRMQMYLWNVNAGGNPIIAAQPSPVADRTYGDFGSPASFGVGALVDSNTMVRAGVVDAVDGVENQDFNDACEDLVNASELVGKIALINRGTCEFGSKAKRAQDAGAVAVIICNYEDATIGMNGGVDGAQVTIPTYMLTSTGCIQLRADADTYPDFELAIEQPDNTGPDYVSGSFDNGIVAHEFGHGVSTRLTGGPNVSCLGGAEQMGEGWSDFFSLVTSSKVGDVGATARGIGTYAERQNTDGRGIRPFPYSTDMSINPVTYEGVADASTFSAPHGIGSIWCSMLWDLHWAMVDEYGFSGDIFHGTLGNNMAIQLVMTGLKLQPCNPGFADGRDAILEADEMLYNGINRELIWQVFADRGLGADSDQGDPNNRSDGTTGFELPNDIANKAYFTKTATPIINGGDDVEVEVLYANWLEEAVTSSVITDEIPAGATLIASSVSLPYTQSGDVLTWELSNVAKGDSTLITYSYTSPAVSSSLGWYEPVVDNSSRFDFEVDNQVPTGATEWEIVDGAGVGFGDNFAWDVLGDVNETQPILEMTEDQEFQVSGASPVFAFQHKFGVTGSDEGAIIEIYTESANRFRPLSNDRIFRGKYTTPVVYQAFVIPLIDGYAGTQADWEQVIIDLSDYVGETVRLRWRYGRRDQTGITTPSAAGAGWTVDELAYGNAVMYNPTANLLINGTESLDANAADIGTFVNFDVNSSTSVAPDGYNKFRAFPNPTGGELSLQWEGDLDAGTVEIHNATGQVVTVQQVAPGEQRMMLDLSSQAPGLYTVRTVRGGVEQTLRVVVQ